GALNVGGLLTATNNLIVSNKVQFAANASELAAIARSKTRALTMTNTSGGGQWLSTTPALNRRRWGRFSSDGNNISSAGDSAASTGAPVNSVSPTNGWSFSTYTTAASLNADVGISDGGVTALTYFPGKHCYGSFVGRLSQT